MSFDGKIVFVTGAARGIGKAIALRFAQEGARVFLVDLMETEGIAAEMQNNGYQARSISLDITDPDAVKDAVDRLVKREGSIDILVNNAGIIARGTIKDLDYETWLKVIDVNLNGSFNCCKAVVPHMIRQRKGRILNIASIAGKMGDITAAPAYGASKGGVITLTRSLARELAIYGITVNAIAPHAIETDMSAEWSEEKRQEVIQSIPLKRMGTALEVAEAVLFLASEKASFITGETLNINGGYLMD
ncbi:MAG TPA: SDR family NAD(P)-dependent oxidoreductase [Spirochaetia bacterium]|nr:SDR family NAD(P)-dependent oxidoreductase [Spirochaetia bacterium]